MRKKGQLSSEFLVILAVVLLVAMVAIGLTLLFSQSSRDIAENEARAYWASQAKPLRILEYQGYYYTSNSSGEFAILVENVDTKPITVRSFVIEPSETTSFYVYSQHSSDGNPSGDILGSSGSSELEGLDIELAPSQRYSFYLRSFSMCSTSEDSYANPDAFDFQFTIYYDTPYFSGLSFKGSKNIIGRCNKN